ncbi:hypothetical protein Q5X59_02675 [Acinetobacter baumannii]|nr:hypothetical protein [Acinetobacter baumannii]
MKKHKITNPNILEVLKNGGYRIRTPTHKYCREVQEHLFKLGFLWLNGYGKVDHVDSLALGIHVNGFGRFPSEEYFFESSRPITNKRAIKGLVIGEDVVCLNRISDATHKRKNGNKYYLVTHKDTYFWSTVHAKWRPSCLDYDNFVNLLAPIQDDLLITEPGGEKPKTKFEDVW